MKYPVFKNLIKIILFVVTVSSYSFANDLTISNGHKVSLHYNLLIHSELIESTVGKKPLEFIVGGGNIIKGLEHELIGMRVGEEKKIIVSPENAYGLVDEKAFKEVLKSALPSEVELKVGAVVEVEDPKGGVFPGVVWEIRTDSVIINFNHPLAGQTLEFDVHVMDIQ